VVSRPGPVAVVRRPVLRVGGNNGRRSRQEEGEGESAEKASHGRPFRVLKVARAPCARRKIIARTRRVRGAPPKVARTHRVRGAPHTECAGYFGWLVTSSRRSRGCDTGAGCRGPGAGSGRASLPARCGRRRSGR